MNQFPLEIVEVIVFHAGSFYNYAALGFCSQEYADALMWKCGGPGAVLSETLQVYQRTVPVPLGDHLRVLHFLHDRYSHFLSLDIALTKAVQTLHPRLVRHVHMIWLQNRSGNNTNIAVLSTMALMVAAASNFWWAVGFLLQSCPCCFGRDNSILLSSSSTATTSTNPIQLPIKLLYMHRRLCNVYHLTQGNVKQVIYTVPRPLQYLRLLHNHPDLDQLSQHLTDKVFTQMYRRQPECQPLLALAAYLGKVEFLTFLAKHNAWFHPLERLLCIAVRGHRPRSAAELFERWTKVHRPTVSSVEMLLQVYGGRSEYMAEIDTVHRALETVKIPCTCTSVRTPQLIQQWRERHLERMIACDDLEGLRGYAAELDPELKSSGYLLQKLLNRNRADLLVRLVESAVADPATVSRVNRVRNYNLRESVFTRPNLLQFQKRILAALIAARPVSQAREAPTVLEFLTEQLRRMGLDPIRPQSVEMQDIFLRVDIDEWRLAMLREQLVTVPEAAIMAMQGQSTSLSITFCYWTQYAKFMAFAYTDRSLWHEAKTHREVEMRALLDTYMSPCGQDDNNNNNNNKRHADEIPLHLVAKATSRVLQRTFLRSFLAINLDHEATARRILNQDSFVRRPAGSIWIGKEFIDQMLVEGSANENLEATALRKCDATLNPRNGRPSAYMDRTHMFWGPWYYSVKSLQRDIFDSFEDVLVMYAGEAIPKAEQSPSLITRTIAFLDPGLPIMELLGESWWKYILSWLQSLDTNMYCQFLASYLAPKD